MASNESIRKTEIRVGIVAILGVVILVVGITLGRGCSVSPSLKTIPIHFSSASGIESTAPVFVNGMRRGQVSSIKPDTNGVLIQVMMDDVSDLHSDATARLTILELTGGKKIEIGTGVAQSPYSGQLIHGQVAPDFGELMTFLGDVSGDAKQLLRRLDTISVSLSQLLADGSFVANLKETATNANASVASLRRILDANHDNIQVAVQNLRTLSDDLKRIVKDNEPQVTTLIHKLDNTANSAQSAITHADSTVQRVDRLVADVHSVVSDIRKGDGTIGRLIYDKDLAIRLDSAMVNLGVLVDQINKYGINVNVRLGTRP